MPDAIFADRRDAGRRLGAELRGRGLAGRAAVAAGIPRGGVVVAAAVALETGLPLRAVLARKIGAPGQPELAIGAMGPDGEAILDRGLVARLGVHPDWLEREVAMQRREIDVRVARFPGVLGASDAEGVTVVVVDDGVATGATAAAVGEWLRRAGAAQRILALPVGPTATLRKLAETYDDVVALAEPRYFVAVGQWYVDFAQTTDDEVISLLSGEGHAHEA